MLAELLVSQQQVDVGGGEGIVADWDYGAATNNPLTLSLLAGLSTCLGATVVFCSGHKKLGRAHMAFSLSLAGSVMITVSVASILPECFQVEVDEGSDNAPADEIAAHARYIGPWEWQFWARWMAFGTGCGLYMMLSKCAFPEPEQILGLETSSSVEDHSSSATVPPVQVLNDDDATRRFADDDDESRSPLLSPQTTTTVQRKPFSNSVKQSSTSLQDDTGDGDDDDDDTTSKPGKSSEAKRAWRVTMLLFVSLAVHNFPEGLAVAASSLHSNKLGWTTTVAIALHNIPEGIAIAIPCLAARPDSPWLAFLLASLSGLAEPLGAAAAVFFLQGDDGWLNNADNMKNVLAFVAGVMIMVASIELFPEARRHMIESKVPGVSGTVAGIVIMLSSDAYLDS